MTLCSWNDEHSWRQVDPLSSRTRHQASCFNSCFCWKTLVEETHSSLYLSLSIKIRPLKIQHQLLPCKRARSFLWKNNDRYIFHYIEIEREREREEGDTTEQRSGKDVFLSLSLFFQRGRGMRNLSSTKKRLSIHIQPGDYFNIGRVPWGRNKKRRARSSTTEGGGPRERRGESWGKKKNKRYFQQLGWVSKEVQTGCVNCMESHDSLWIFDKKKEWN